MTRFVDPRGYRMANMGWEVLPVGSNPDPLLQIRPLIAFQIEPCDLFSLWISQLDRGRSWTGSTTDLPPTLDLTLKSGWGALTTIQTAQLLVPPKWGDTAFAFQASGRASTRFEIWGCTRDGGPGRPVAPVAAIFACLITISGCCEPKVIVGPWVGP
jgi:hypothetical protein